MDSGVEQTLPLDRAEKQMFDKLYTRFDEGNYNECREIIDIMERLSII